MFLDGESNVSWVRVVGSEVSSIQYVPTSCTTTIPFSPNASSTALPMRACYLKPDVFIVWQKKKCKKSCRIHGS